MKKILLITLMLFGTAFSYAQQAKTRKKNEKTSVSVHNDNNLYTLNANYNAQKDEKVKATIIKALGKATKKTGDELIWEYYDVYLISLKSGKLSIKFDKNSNSSTDYTYKSIAELGESIQKSLNQPKPPKVE